MGKAVTHWITQRLTAVTIIPLSLWFLYSLIENISKSHQEMQDWVKEPVIAILLAGSVISIFWHARLGMQVIIEDYIHGNFWQKAALVSLNAMILGLVTICLVSIVIIVVT